MVKGLKELKRNKKLPYNKLNELVNVFLLYGKYNVENTENIVLTINSLQIELLVWKVCFLALK